MSNLNFRKETQRVQPSARQFSDRYTDPSIKVRREYSLDSNEVPRDPRESEETLDALSGLQNKEKRPQLVEPEGDPDLEGETFNGEFEDDYSETGSEYSDTPEQETKKDEPRMTYEQMQNEKIKYLSKLDRLRSRGVYLDRTFTMKSELLEIKEYYDRLTHGKHVENGVKMCEKTLRFCINGIEALNKMYDPFDIDLDGWGEEVDDEINDGNYQDVFEELYEKYSGKSSMAPELKLLLMVVGGGAAFNLKKKMQKKFFMQGGGVGGAQRGVPPVLGNSQPPNSSIMESILNRKAPVDMPPPVQDVNEIVRKMQEDLKHDSDNEEPETKTFNVSRGKKKAGGINIDI